MSILQKPVNETGMARQTSLVQVCLGFGVGFRDMRNVCMQLGLCVPSDTIISH